VIASPIVRLRCSRCGLQIVCPDDGRVWGHATIHVSRHCPATPRGSWTPVDYRARNVDGLPEIDLYGAPWLRVARETT
jgi:hypothetical protein